MSVTQCFYFSKWENSFHDHLMWSTDVAISWSYFYVKSIGLKVRLTWVRVLPCYLLAVRF